MSFRSRRRPDPAREPGAARNFLRASRWPRATVSRICFPRDDTAEIRVPDEARAAHRAWPHASWNCTGEPQDLHLAVTVSALEEKATSGFVIVLEDTSELLRAQKAAAWHEVARRIAHEIKNPLTPIALSAPSASRARSTAELPPEAAADRARVLGDDRARGGIGEELVDEFSQFARFPAAQPVRCDLNEVVRDGAGGFRRTAGRHRGSVRACSRTCRP